MVGGEVTVELNGANINRDEALYQAVGGQRFDTAYGLYSVCSTYTPGTTNSNCLLRGIAGDYTRATEQISWSKKIVDPIGEVWKPFIFERLSGEATSLAGGSFNYSSSTGSAIIPNYAQARLLRRRKLGLGGSRDGGRWTGIPLSVRLELELRRAGD